MAHQRVNPALVGCGLSAAAALGLPLPQEDFGLPVPLAQPPQLRRRKPGERAARIRNGPVVVPVEQVIIDCARVLPIEWGLAVADAAIFKGWITEDRLGTAGVPDRSRWAHKVRWVLGHARARVESPLESLARAVIIRGGFPEPEVQRIIETWAGAFRVDLLDAVAGLITEADGKVKYRRNDGKDDPLWREKRREDALRDAGSEVIRFTMADYYRQPRFLERYAKARTRALRKR